jgi:hypothetical protein
VFCVPAKLPQAFGKGANLPSAPVGRIRVKILQESKGSWWEEKKEAMETLGQGNKAGLGTMPKHKGGRPKKKIRRDREVKVRLTATEHFFVKSKARDARMRMADWFRRSAVTAKIVPLLSREDKDLLHIITGMANNLNQLTKLAHTSGILTVAIKCNELLNQIEEAIQYFNRHDREDTQTWEKL